MLVILRRAAGLGKLEKLYQRALNNPGSVSFDELSRLLQFWGFTVRQPRGGSSHYVYKRGAIALSIPRDGKGVKPIYVKRAMAVLESIDLEG
jgi:hypothetical protein